MSQCHPLHGHEGSDPVVVALLSCASASLRVSRVEYEALVACSSCVDNEGKASLAQDVQQLGGRLVSSWSEDCTHLVMPAVKVTIKTICALLCCRPIVRPHYFSEFRKALLEKKAPPKAEDFCPDIDEPTLDREVVDLGVRLQRRSVFQGKTFVFLSAKQLKRLSSAVTFGRGQAQLLEEGSLPTALLESPQTCVVDAETGSSQVLQSASAVMWNDSVARILQRFFFWVLRFIEGLGLLGGLVSWVFVGLWPFDAQDPVFFGNRCLLEVRGQWRLNHWVCSLAMIGSSAYRMDTSGPTSVGETPEKEQRRTGVLSKRPTETDTACKSLATETSSSASAARAKSLQSTNEKDALPSRARGDGQPTSRPPLSNGAKTRSPEKQANSLTNYFQPISRKRIIGGSELVAHNRGKNSELEEWLREAAEVWSRCRGGGVAGFEARHCGAVGVGLSVAEGPTWMSVFLEGGGGTFLDQSEAFLCFRRRVGMSEKKPLETISSGMAFTSGWQQSRSLCPELKNKTAFVPTKV
uniref:BRCT domain-containing protein n=1 Tax=Scleropages formosus TaxID=113540 RepID=A0A8C9WMX0_SCLFO